MVLKAARLQMKQYMGEWRFLFHMTATTTRKFSARLASPMVKKREKGTLTSGQSDCVTELVFILDQDVCSAGIKKLINMETKSILPSANQFHNPSCMFSFHLVTECAGFVNRNKE